MTESLHALLTDAKKLYYEGHHQEALEKYLLASQQGDLSAQAFVGQMYFMGEGTLQNYEEAIKWYTAAAMRDHPPAQSRLAYFYFHVRKDIPKAIEWYQKAVSNGHMVAMWRLGKIYQHGMGVPADKDKALRYFEQAAKLGHIFALRQLAVSLIRGHRGWAQIPLGFRLLAKCIVNGARIAWQSEDDERLRN